MKFHSISTKIPLRAGQRIVSVIRSFEWIGKLKSIRIGLSGNQSASKSNWKIDQIVVVDPQFKETCLFEVNEILSVRPSWFARARSSREASWMYFQELIFNWASFITVIKSVVYQWALTEPVILLFLPS